MTTTSTMYDPAEVRDEMMKRFGLSRAAWYYHCQRYLPLTGYYGRRRVWTEAQYEEIVKYFAKLSEKSVC